MIKVEIDHTFMSHNHARGFGTWLAQKDNMVVGRDVEILVEDTDMVSKVSGSKIFRTYYVFETEEDYMRYLLSKD